ncbi:MAG: hypothetical protein M1537_04585 [Nitrospirae bacterium]|nr:hypothetical protein [Nitrospirota bacterium]
MPWPQYEILSGLVDVLLILTGVALMVQVRILRKSVRKLRGRSLEISGEGSSHSSFPPTPAVSVSGPTPAERELERERQRLEALVREAEGIRSELSILFYDVQRFLDDLTPIARSSSTPDGKEKEGVVEPGRMYPLPGDEEFPDSGPPSARESMKETVLRLSREGRSVPEIASAIGRGEGEVAFLLSMEKVGRP